MGAAGEPRAADPPSPAGYGPPEEFRYPKGPLQAAAIALVLALTPPLLGLAWLLQGRPDGLPLRFGQGDLWIAAVTILATMIIHEFIHGLAYQLQGYAVRYGVSLKLFAAYAGAFGQWQRRDDNIRVALAPLLVITLAAVPLLALANPTIVLIAWTALLFNTGGAVGDLYLAWRLRRLPPAALLYDVDTSRMLIYLPEPGAGEAAGS